VPVRLAFGAVDHAAPFSFTAIRSAAMRIVPVVLAVAIGAVLPGRVPAAGFLALAVIVGLPHGAFDHKVARRAFERGHRAGWWRPFLAGYLALAAAMLLIWWALPVLALSIFLLLSIFHFGDQDAPAQASHRSIRIVAHGGVPIIVSAVCHPEAIERLLAALVPGHAHIVTMLLDGPLALLWVGAVICTLIAYAARGRADDWTVGADLVLVTLLFAVAPPLIAFSLYFAAIHAPRAITAAMPAGGMRAGELVLPLVLTVLGLGLGAVISTTGTAAPTGDNVVRTAFLLLSALTVPHMWLDWRARMASRGPVAPTYN